MHRKITPWFGLLVLIIGGSMVTRAETTKVTKRADIVETAIQAGSFNTLVKAVQAAGLVDTLRGDGPFTVFAPTDEAFSKVPSDTLEALLENPEMLRAVLTYHVVPGRLMASDVVKLSSAKTAQGQSLRIDTRDGVMIGDARVVKADIEASNGVIHVIDSVMIPQN
jgi:uncharacterized surface protein with fasciclin (FAS1) repeats